MNNTQRFIAFAACLLALAACSNTKRQLGLVPTAPDEFTVVKRAPLSMPPDFTLRPPQPGMERPQDAVTAQQAQEAVFGDETGRTSSFRGSKGAAAILQDTGADQADPNIRNAVNAEAAHTPATQKPVAQRLVGWAGIGNQNNLPPAKVVDPVAEATRLQKDQKTGQPVTAGGPTPSTDN